MRRTATNYRFYTVTIDYFSFFQLTRNRSINMPKKLTTEEFIAKAIAIHGNKYDYSNVIYINSKTKVKIKCTICDNEFCQRPNDHISGKGCRMCAYKNIAIHHTTPFEEFESRANTTHNHKYTYDNNTYTTTKIKTTIYCDIHGKFKQTPHMHLMGQGCPQCGIISSNTSRTKSLESFIDESSRTHNYKYTYTYSIYNTSKTKLIITCPLHGNFEQTPNNHLKGNGCPSCSESKGERAVSEVLSELNIQYIKQHTFDGCKFKNPLHFDFYLPNHNCCIEYDGIHHFTPINFSGTLTSSEIHESLVYTKIRDNIKNDYCKANGIKLIRIPFTQFKNIRSIILGEVKSSPNIITIL